MNHSFLAPHSLLQVLAPSLNDNGDQTIQEVFLQWEEPRTLGRQLLLLSLQE